MIQKLNTEDMTDKEQLGNQTFNPNNRISLNDMVEGLFNGKEYKVISYSLGERYINEIITFNDLARLILEIDYNQLTNIQIEEL